MECFHNFCSELMLGNGNLKTVIVNVYCLWISLFASLSLLSLCISALWSTRQTENTMENRELQFKVTLRELLIYVTFLIDICICELCFTFFYSVSYHDKCIKCCSV